MNPFSFLQDLNKVSIYLQPHMFGACTLVIISHAYLLRGRNIAVLVGEILYREF